MEKWKSITIDNLKIERCVGEFNIWETEYSPYAKFKIKIFEDRTGAFTGSSNLHVRDELGFFYCAIGYGNTLEEALEDTLNQFFQMVSRKEAKEWAESDFECADSFNF